MDSFSASYPSPTIVWTGPSTLSGLSGMTASASAATATPSSQSTGFTSTRDLIIIICSTCGGVIVLAIALSLLWMLLMRRRRQSETGSVAQKPFSILTRRSRRRAESLTALPLYTVPEQSMVPSNIASPLNSRSSMQNKVRTSISTPAFVLAVERVDAIDDSASLATPLATTDEKQSSEKVTHAPALASNPPRRATPVKLTKPRPAHLKIQSIPRSQSRRRSNPPPALVSPWLEVPTTQRPQSTSQTDSVPHVPPPSPTSSESHTNRWSWTNSQAPATPRIFAPNRRSIAWGQSASNTMCSTSRTPPRSPSSDVSDTDSIMTMRPAHRQSMASTLRVHGSMASRTTNAERIDKEEMFEGED